MPNALGFLILTAAGWINRQHEETICYLRAENRVLKEQLGGKRLRLTGPQRRRLAIRGKRLGRFTLPSALPHKVEHSAVGGRPPAFRS
jgi:hypothetical protein